jgi:DNA-binding MarR family transcriptional regulator
MSIKKDIQTKGFHSEQEKAFVNLIHTAAHFESLFSHFIKDFGLSPQQYNVLRILRGQSPNAILGGELQKRMLHNMSNATRLVDKLVEKGLVDRSKNSNDKRQILVSINKQGLKVLAKLDNEVVNFDEKIMNLPEAQLMVLNLLLDDLRASSKE